MDRYVDIRILPDPEFPPEHLMNALFAKLHLCLVRLRTDDVGISFPGVNPSKPQLGRVLRLHGTDTSLVRVLDEKWLTGMRDHVQIGAIGPVPETVEHRRVRRIQAKSNVERIRRRQMKRHQLSEEEAKQRIPDSAEETLSLPYLIIGSASTGHQFRLFIDHQDASGPATGKFNGYGLSDSATVPWF